MKSPDNDAKVSDFRDSPPQPPRRLALKMLQCRLPKTRTEPRWWTALWTSLCRGDRLIPPPNRAARSPPCHFFAGPENRLVEVAVRSVVEEQINGYNPLVFYGPSGTGKSHLAHGLAAAWKARDRRQRVVCTTAVDFARELADAIETQGVDEFRAKHRGAALLVVEDLGMLATRKSGKLNAQEELIHTLDALVAEDRWVVVTASAAPAALPGILPALQSRLTAGLLIPLAPPGVEARLAIFEQLAALRNIPLPEAGGPRACRRACRHGAGVGRLAAAIGHAGRDSDGPVRRGSGSAIRCQAQRRAAADAARNRLGHGPAFFAAAGRLAQSGAAQGVGRRPRRGRLPRPAAHRARASNRSAATSAAATIRP